MKKIYPIWYIGLTLSLCVFLSAVLLSYKDVESLLLNKESIALIVIIVTMGICVPGFHYGLDADAFYVCWYFRCHRIPYNVLDSVINWRFGGYWFRTIDGRTFAVILLFEKKKLYMILDHILAKNSRCDISEITGYHLKHRPYCLEPPPSLAGFCFFMVKRVKIIFALLSISTLILSIILFEKHTNMIGGTAIDGYKKNEVFYVCIAPDTYKQVDKIDWYYNFILSIIMLTSGSLTVLLYAYFGIRHFYPWIKYKHYENIYDHDKHNILHKND